MSANQRVPRVTVSVVLTVYRRTDYVLDAIDSVLAQTFLDREIIVADDSGSFAAKPIVDMRADAGCILYLANSKTLGVSQSVANAVTRARGDFVAIINDDDLWEPSLLERLIAPLLSDPDCVLACSDHWVMDHAGNLDHELSERWTVQCGRHSRTEGNVNDAGTFIVERGGAALNLAAVFRKEAVDWSLLTPEVAGAYDYWISCLLARTRKRVYFVPERLARWRAHQESETRRRSHDKAAPLVFMFARMIEERWFPELEIFLKQRLAEAWCEVGRDKLQFGRHAEARASFWRSFLLAPGIGAALRAARSCLPLRFQGALRRSTSPVRAKHSR
jgi:cellulose synthase/poly-beta-1,6-N-acetylglucosamine synthase-like glycosyltransferase